MGMALLMTGCQDDDSNKDDESDKDDESNKNDQMIGSGNVNNNKDENNKDSANTANQNASNTEVPKTGDKANVMIYIITMAVAVLFGATRKKMSDGL